MNYIDIDIDIDGDQALSVALDRENANYDKVSATRRVARTIFLGSAPTFRSENKGIDDRTIRLGVVQPGENVAIFGDALRAFSDRATYLYSEHGRYWFATQPSVTQIAQERIAQLPQDDVDHEIVELLRKQQASRGLFDRVHVAPIGSGDVVDTPDVTLVMLGPGEAHVRNQHDASIGPVSNAITTALKTLDTRGDGRRLHRNALLFLAPDCSKLEDLRKAVAQHLVWKEIHDARESLNLDSQQTRQASSRSEDAKRTVEARLRDTWQWLLAPWAETTPGSSVQWEARQLKAVREDEALPVAAGERARSEELMISQYAATNLRRQIDEIPSFRDGWTHVAIRDLANWFSSYLYLPRLKNAKVLEESIQSGLRSISWQFDTFAYADSYDETDDRYRGLTTAVAHVVAVSMSGPGLLVHPAVAQRQFAADEQRAQERKREQSADAMPTGEMRPHADIAESRGAFLTDTQQGRDTGDGLINPPMKAQDPRRYFGSVTLNPQTLASQVREISQEVVSNLQGIYGAEVRISLEIQAIVPDGIPEDRRRAVIENSKALKFDQSDFADE